MSRLRLYVVVAAWFMSSAAVVEAATVFNDGGSHVIDYYVPAPVDVDFDTPGAGTQVSVVDGANLAAWLDAYEDCSVGVSGGQIAGSLKAWDNSIITIVGGRIGGPVIVRDNVTLDISAGRMQSWVQAFDQAEVTITGGQMDLFVEAWNQSSVTISGGTIANHISAVAGGLVVIDGSDFLVNGQPVSPTASLGDYGANGTISGVLVNGDLFETNYVISGFDSQILLVPEPMTFMLLGLGGLLLRRKG